MDHRVFGSIPKKKAPSMAGAGGRAKTNRSTAIDGVTSEFITRCRKRKRSFFEECREDVRSHWIPSRDEFKASQISSKMVS